MKIKKIHLNANMRDINTDYCAHYYEIQKQCKHEDDIAKKNIVEKIQMRDTGCESLTIYTCNDGFVILG